MSEVTYYETNSIWDVNRYTTPEETRRFDEVAAMIPADAESLLDLGAGNGIFLRRLFDSRKMRYSGLERSDSARLVAHDELGIDLVAGDVADVPFPDAAFDVVSSLQVLEHLPTPTFDKARAEMARVARRYVIVNVPYKEHRFFNRCPECGTRFPDYYHVRQFIAETMDTLIPGFTLRRTEYTSIISRPLLSILYHLTIKSIRGSFNSIAKCPLCGYSANHASAAPRDSQGMDRVIGGLKTIRLFKWPSFPWYREVICLYERTR